MEGKIMITVLCGNDLGWITVVKHFKCSKEHLRYVKLLLRADEIGQQNYSLVKLFAWTLKTKTVLNNIFKINKNYWQAEFVNLSLLPLIISAQVFVR